MRASRSAMGGALDKVRVGRQIQQHSPQPTGPRRIVFSRIVSGVLDTPMVHQRGTGQGSGLELCLERSCLTYMKFT